MKKQNVFPLLPVLVLSILSVTNSFAQSPYTTQHVESNEDCVIPKVSGERVPFPLQKANTKFDLSENQTYLLNGTLVVMNDKIYLKIDFNTQPYLATQKMVQFPYLAMDSVNAATVARMNGRLVQVAVVTRKLPASSLEGGNGLKLNAILPPQVL